MIKEFITAMFSVFLGLSLVLCCPIIIDAQTSTIPQSGDKIMLPGGVVEVTKIDKKNFGSEIIDIQKEIQISLNYYRNVPVCGVDFFSQTDKYPKNSHLKIFYFSEDIINDVFIGPNPENHAWDAYGFVKNDLRSWRKGGSSVFVMKLLGLDPVQGDKVIASPWTKDKTGDYEVDKMEIFDTKNLYATRLFSCKPYIVLTLFEVGTDSYKATTEEQKRNVEQFCKDTIASIVVKIK